MCRTSKGDVPLANVHLELYDSDCRGSHVCDDRMDQRDPNTGQDRNVSFHTEADGSFTIDGYGGDWDPDIGAWTKPEPYVAALLQNEGFPRASVQDEIEHIRSKTSGEDRFDDECPVDVHLVPDLIYDGDAAAGEITRCEVFLETRRVAQDYYALTGGSEPKYGEVRTLIWSIAGGLTYADYDKIRWSVSRPLGTTLADGRVTSTVGHEFAHTVYFTFDGDHPHWTGDLSAFRYASNHEYCDAHFTAGMIDYQRRGFAFSEGWGDYWEGKYNGCGTLNGCSPIGPSCKWCYPIVSSLGLLQNPECVPNWGDTTNFEGNNARAFRLLERRCNLTRAQLLGVFSANPGQIHSWEEYYDKLRAVYPTCSISLAALSSVVSALTQPAHDEVVDRAAERAIEARDRSVLQQSVAALKGEFHDARAEAKLPCAFGTADCAAAQIAPWALWGARKQTLLELKRRGRLHPTGLPYDPVTSRKVEKSKERYEKKYGKVLSKVFAKAGDAVAKLDGDYSSVLQKLQERGQAVETALAAGTLPPWAAAVPLALDGGVTSGQTPEPLACGDSSPSCDGVCPEDEACAASIDPPYDCGCYSQQVPCGGSEPACDGPCPAGQACAASIDPPYDCGCYTQQPPCGDTEPACDGLCPAGEVCAASIDPPYDCGCYPEP